MSSEDYEVVPINNKCTTQVNSLVITTKPGSSVSTVSNNVNSINYQQQVYSQYDNTEEIYVKPMFGGAEHQFNIKFINKYYKIQSDNEINAIKKVLNNRIFKLDHLVIVNDTNIYIIRGRYKNKFKKI